MNSKTKVNSNITTLKLGTNTYPTIKRNNNNNAKKKRKNKNIDSNVKQKSNTMSPNEINAFSNYIKNIFVSTTDKYAAITSKSKKNLDTMATWDTNATINIGKKPAMLFIQPIALISNTYLKALDIPDGYVYIALTDTDLKQFEGFICNPVSIYNLLRARLDHSLIQIHADDAINISSCRVKLPSLFSEQNTLLAVSQNKRIQIGDNTRLKISHALDNSTDKKSYNLAPNKSVTVAFKNPKDEFIETITLKKQLILRFKPTQLLQEYGNAMKEGNLEKQYAIVNEIDLDEKICQKLYEATNGDATFTDSEQPTFVIKIQGPEQTNVTINAGRLFTYGIQDDKVITNTVAFPKKHLTGPYSLLYSLITHLTYIPKIEEFINNLTNSVTGYGYLTAQGIPTSLARAITDPKNLSTITNILNAISKTTVFI